MPRRESPLQSEMPQGALDMLVLQTLVLGPAHGHTIAHAIERRSENVLEVAHGIVVPSVASSRKPQLDRVVLGYVGEQPESPVLPPDPARTQAVGRACPTLGATGAGGRPDHEAGDRLDPWH